VLPIPHAVGNVLGYVVAIAAGMVVTALLVNLLKRTAANGTSQETDEEKTPASA